MWTNHAIKLLHQYKPNHTYREVADLINKELGTNFTRDSIRSKWRRVTDENVQVKSDGTQISRKIIEIASEEDKTPEYILQAHGYDVSMWELIDNKMSAWEHHNKVDGTKTLYSSKLYVKPKQESHIEQLINKIDDIEKINIQPKGTGKGCLEIPLMDMHFGISALEDYQSTLEDIVSKIGYHDQYIVTVGSDMLHVDSTNNTTTSGTRIEDINLEKAYEDAFKFFATLLEKCLETAPTKMIYVGGNHDLSMSWAFAKMLEKRYNVEADTSLEYWKVTSYGDNLIGYTHGDKRRKELHNVFFANFREQFATHKNIELHCGHLHHEESIDKYGVMVRGLATKNKTDKWHRDSGFVGNNKRFQLFEYDEHQLKSIHYV